MGWDRSRLPWRIASAAACWLGLGVVAAAMLVVLGAVLPSDGALLSGAPPGGLLFVGCALVLLAGGLQRRAAVAGVLAAVLLSGSVFAALPVPRPRMVASLLAVVVVLLAVRDAVIWPTRRQVALVMWVGGFALVALMGFRSLRHLPAVLGASLQVEFARRPPPREEPTPASETRGHRPVGPALTSNAIVCSRRDRPAPGQCVSPSENATWRWALTRSTSIVVGSGKATGSRLPAAVVSFPPM